MKNNVGKYPSLFFIFLISGLSSSLETVNFSSIKNLVSSTSFNELISENGY